MSTSSKKAAKPAKPAKSKPSKSAKDKLAAGAAAIKKAEAEAKKKNVSSTTPPKDGGKLEVLPKIETNKEDIGAIMQRRVTIDGFALALDSNTEAGEYVRIFDSISGQVEMGGLILGDLINQGAELKCFGGKYAAAMASTGRSVDRLKTFASVAKNTPLSLREMITKRKEIQFEHIREISKVPELEDKKGIVKELVEAAKEGKPLTVKQVREKADKFKPRKKKKVKPAKPAKEPKLKRDITVEEKDILISLESKASDLCAEIEGASFALEIHTHETAILREKLERIARFFGQLNAEV